RGKTYNTELTEPPMTIGRRAFVACMLAFSFLPPTQAQTRRRLTLVDLLNVPRLTDPQLSPDGRQIAYQLAEADWKANKRVSHIWRIGVDGAGLVRMTSGADEQSARWSPDGSSITFAGKRSGSEDAQVYVIPNSGGAAREITHHQTSVTRPTG